MDERGRTLEHGRRFHSRRSDEAAVLQRGGLEVWRQLLDGHLEPAVARWDVAGAAQRAVLVGIVDDVARAVVDEQVEVAVEWQAASKTRAQPPRPTGESGEQRMLRAHETLAFSSTMV